MQPNAHSVSIALAKSSVIGLSAKERGWGSGDGRARRSLPFADLFSSKYSPCPMSGCWLWFGAVNAAGYGRFTVQMRDPKRRTVSWAAHRLSYEMRHGPIPDGLVLDHRCRVTCCVNPDHLRPVTNKVNVLIGTGITAVNSRKAYCQHGHALTGDNLTIRPNGARECRECRRETTRRYRARKAT